MASTPIPNSLIRICRLVTGTPLAILLASTWIKMLTVDEIATEIERNLAFLQADLQSLPARQRSLQAVFNHSWDLLSQRERDILVQLSIFRGGFDNQAAQAVTGAELPDLLALVEKSLLHRTPAGRYEVHELLRQFAAQKLWENPQKEKSAWLRHSAYYTCYLAQREADLKGTRQKKALAEIQLELENIRVAWGQAVEQRQFDFLDQAIDCLGYFYLWQAYYQDGETACRIAAMQLIKFETEEVLHILAKVWLWQSIFNRHLGHTELAEQLIQQSLSLLDDPVLADQDIQAEKAAILLELGQQSGNLVDGTSWFKQALALYRALEDDWRTAQALYLLGNMFRLQTGHYDEGQQALAESLQIRQRLGDQRGIAEILESLGFSATLRGEGETSERVLRQSLAIHRESDDKAATANNLIGLVYDLGHNQGQFNEAYDLLEEASNIIQDLGIPRLMAIAKASLSWVQRHRGHYDAAHILGEISLNLGKELNEPGIVSYALWVLGSIALVKEDYAEAKTLLAKSVTIHQAISFHDRMQDVRVSLGYALLGLGKIGQAQECLVEPIRAALASRSLITLMLVVPLVALIEVAHGRPERAVEFYALASRYPYVANSRWFADVAGQHIAAAAEMLPSNVVAAAQKRGRARDLWETAEELATKLS